MDKCLVGRTRDVSKENEIFRLGYSQALAEFNCDDIHFSADKGNSLEAIVEPLI